MTTRYRTVSVRLAPGADRRLEKAAALIKQSRGAFLERAGDEASRRVLREWAVNRYRQGGQTFSELAEETGLAVEEIMTAMGERGWGAALEMFLASSKTVAETQGNPAFLRLAQETVDALSAERPNPSPSRGGSLAPDASRVVRWEVDGEWRVLISATDEQRRAVDAAIADFGTAREGGKGGSQGLAADLKREWTDGRLRRRTVAQLSKWCHSAGPGYRGKAQRMAHSLSVALFGYAIPLLDDTPSTDREWHELGER